MDNNVLKVCRDLCVECNGVIDKGESILWCKENDAKHKDCPDDMINHNNL